MQVTAMDQDSPLARMNISMTPDFIGKFEGAFSRDFCRRAIDYFNAMDRMGFGRSRQEIEGVPAYLKDTVMVNTTRVTSAGVNDISIVGVPLIQQEFLERAWLCYNVYRQRYSVLQTQAEQAIYEVKIQRTEIGGGFHVWHWEQEGRINTTRLMNVQLFLNDVREGGETEFLYLNRIEPSCEGTLLIYPGNYTHTHRGNPPRSGTKYLINAWIEF